MIEIHLINDLRHGGAQTQLCVVVRKSLEQGREVHIASLSSSLYGEPKGVADRLRELGATLHTIGNRFTVDPFAALRLKRLCYAIDPEKVCTWDVASGQLLRSASRPTESEWTHVVRELDAWDDLPQQDLQLAQRADQVVTSSEAIVERIEKQLPAVPIIQSNQAYLGNWSGDKESARAELGLSPEVKLAVMVGRLDDSQYLKETIWNADLVRILHKEFMLVIIGDGPSRQAGERFAYGATDEGVVHFVGNQANAKSWLIAADVVWCPNRSVGLSTPMVEAMQLAKPLVATTSVERESLIDSGINGYLAKYNDRAAWAKATDKLLSSSTHAEEIGQAGKSRLGKLIQPSEPSEPALI